MESANMCSIPCLRPPGSDVTILITKVNLNPLCGLVELWGNFDQERKAAYERLAEDIQCPRKIFHDLEGSPGDLCLVRLDETWYRAKIVSRNGTNYSVFLFDKGLTISSNKSMLAWGQNDIFHLPPEVEFCVLSNILPLSPENRWSPMALEFLRSLSGKSVAARIQDVLVPHRTFLLDIPCISKQMYEMGFAKWLPPEQFMDFVLMSLQSHSGTVMSSEFHKGSLRNELLNISEQKQEQFMYPELQTGTVETVIVTEVTNPLRIFCQLKVFSLELKKLAEQLTQHYEGRLGAYEVRPDMLGSPCVARGRDGGWYRSILQQIIPANNVVEVLHVDYGQKQFVQTENIRPLAPEFFRMPVVAYVCSLHGIIDKGMGWTAAQVDYLRSLLLYKTVIAKFQYQSVSEGVHYVTLYGDENMSINNLFGSKEKCLLDSEKSLRDYAIHRNPFRPQHPALLEHQGNIPAPLKAMKETEGKAVTKVQVKLPVEDLPLNSSHVAVVQHVSNPSEFWIQTKKYANEFNELMDGIADLYSDLVCEDVVRNLTVGLYCAAKAPDGAFYRTTVTEVGETQIKVYFVDCGNTDMVDRSSIRVLPDEFKELPQLALQCKLSDVKPKDETWSHNATDFFTKTVADKVLDVHVKAKRDGGYVVQVTDSEACGERDVSKLMCNSGFAEKDEAQKKPTAKVTFRPAITPTTLNPGAILYDPYKKSDSCVQLQTTDPTRTESRSTFKEHMFPIGSTLDVNVSNIESLNDFWCQLVQNAGHLQLLMQDMQTYYEGSQFQQPVEKACVARHPHNGMWCRALVIQKHVTPQVDVLFVDYGQKKTVSLHDLRRISPTFLNLKGQAFRCSLYNPGNPTSVMNDWSEDAIAQFHEFVDTAASNHVILKCTIYAVMYNDQGIVFNVVDLETPFESIGNQMVQSAPLSKTPTPFFCLDTYCYSTHNIKTGTEEKVNVTCVKSVNHFYCQLERNADVVEDLAVKVDTLCHQLKNVNLPKAIGTVCFAKYTDGHWFRGQIKATQPSVLVHFVDYGDTIEVDKSDLLQIPKEASDIMAVPVQAVECGLSDIPFDVSSEVNSWFKTSAIDHSFRALVVAKEPGSKLLVELYEEKTQVNAKIKERFCIEMKSKEQVVCQGRKTLKDNTSDTLKAPNSVPQRAYRVEDKTQAPKTNWGFTSKQVHPMGDGTKQPAPKPLRQMDDNGQKTLAPLLRPYSAPPSEPYRIPHQGQLSGRTPSCMRNDSDPVEVNTKPMNQNTQTEPKQLTAPKLLVTETKKKGYVAPEPNVKALPKLTDLPSKSITSGMEADVFASHCNSLLSFYVQLVKDKDDIFSIVEKLNDGQSATETIDIKDIHSGDLVNAEFPDDSSWYRAVVREIYGEMALVEFIDFGNTATVSISKMCRLLRPFLQIPRLSTHCLLSGAAAHGNEEELDPEIVSTFKEAIGSNGDKELKCRFVRQSGSLWEVSLEENGRKVLCKIPTRGPITMSDVTPDCSEEVEGKPGLITTTTTREMPTEKSTFNTRPLHYLTVDLTVGQSLEAYVATITGPQSFWCQSANSEELDMITESVSEVGNAVQYKPVCANSLSPGSACVALFTDDEQWYRAEVISKDGDVLSILFVDYGNESHVNVADVREIPLELVEYPSQAFLCQLEGFDASHGSWDDGAVDQLSELITEKLLQLTVVRVSMEEESRTTCFIQVECEGQVINETMKAHWKSASAEKKPDGTGASTSYETPSLACESAINETTKPESHPLDGHLRTSENLIQPEIEVGLSSMESPKDYNEQSTYDYVDQLVELVIIQAADETSELAGTLNEGDCSDDSGRSEPIADAQKEMKDLIPSECNVTDKTHAVTWSQSLTEMVTHKVNEMKSIPTIMISGAEPSDTGAIEPLPEDVNEDQTTPSPPAKDDEQDALTSSTVNAVETDKDGEKEIALLTEKTVGPDDSDAPLYLDEYLVKATASYVDQTQKIDEIFQLRIRAESGSTIAKDLGTKEERSHVEEAESETLIAELEVVPEDLETKDEEDNSDIVPDSEFGPLLRATDSLLVGSNCVIWSPAFNSWCKAKVLKKMKDCTQVLLIDHDTEMVVDPDNIFEIMVSDQCDNEDSTDSDTSSSRTESQEDPDEHSDDSEDTIAGDDPLNTVAAEEMVPENSVPETNFDLHKTLDIIPVEPNQVQEESPLSLCAPSEQPAFSDQTTETGESDNVQPVAPVSAEEKDDVIRETSHEEEHCGLSADSKPVAIKQQPVDTVLTQYMDDVVVEATWTAEVAALVSTDLVAESETMGSEQSGDTVPNHNTDKVDTTCPTEETCSADVCIDVVAGSESVGGEQSACRDPSQNTCLLQQVGSLEDHLVQAATEDASPVQRGLEPVDEPLADVEVFTSSPTEHAVTQVLKDDVFEAETCFSDDDSLEMQTAVLTHLSLLIDDNSDDSIIFVSEFRPQQQQKD